MRRSKIADVDFTLAVAGQHLLGRLVGTRVRQIVWDLNALYLVRTNDALKVEVLADAPPADVRTSEYDEVVYIHLETVVPAPPFRDKGEEGYWYKVVANDEEIRAIEVARTVVSYPSGIIGLPTRFVSGQRGVIADVGVVVTLSNGVVPAIVLGNSFGFATWPEIRVYQRDEMRELLRDDYELRPCGGGS